MQETVHEDQCKEVEASLADNKQQLSTMYKLQVMSSCTQALMFPTNEILVLLALWLTVGSAAGRGAEQGAQSGFERFSSS